MRASHGQPSRTRGRQNPVQRLTYLVVIFVLFPLMIWTGLAMSPAFVSAVPSTVTILGGRQSARTLHFAATLSLVAFGSVHLVMISARRIQHARHRDDHRRRRQARKGDQ